MCERSVRLKLLPIKPSYFFFSALISCQLSFTCTHTHTHTRTNTHTHTHTHAAGRLCTYVENLEWNTRYVKRNCVIYVMWCVFRHVLFYYGGKKEMETHTGFINLPVL